LIVHRYFEIGKINDVFKNWIETLDFLLENNKNFYRLAIFKGVLTYIHFHSLDTIILDEEVEKIMLIY